MLIKNRPTPSHLGEGIFNKGDAIPCDNEEKEIGNIAAYQAWKKVVELGDLDKIRAMSVLEFAKVLGAKDITDSSLKLMSKVPFLPVSDKLWQVIKRFRQIGIKNRKKLGLVFDLALCREINAPNIYYSMKGIQYLKKKKGLPVMTKAAFFHESLEMSHMKYDLLDEDWQIVLKHYHPDILRHELMFARLLGMDEFQIALAHVNGQLDEWATIRRLLDNFEMDELKQQYVLSFVLAGVPEVTVPPVQEDLSAYDVVNAKKILAKVVNDLQGILSLASEDAFYYQGLQAWQEIKLSCC